MLLEIFALIGRIILLGFERIFLKKSGENKDSVVSTFLFFSLAGVTMFPLLFFINLPIYTFLIAIPSALIYSLTFYLYTYSVSNYEVSLVTPLYNFNVFFLFLLSILFLNESFSYLKLFGILFLFYGLTYLEKNDKNTSLMQSIKAVVNNKGCRAMALMSFLQAIGRSIDTFLVRDNRDPIGYTFALYALISLFIFISLIMQKKLKLIKGAYKESSKSFWLGGFSNAYSYLFLLVALLAIDISIAEPLCMLSIIVSIFLSYLFFKENIKYRVIGALIMFIGAFILVFSI
ncbi:MAG: EamA family transporter [Promethearchaeota archaeon]